MSLSPMPLDLIYLYMQIIRRKQACEGQMMRTWQAALSARIGERFHYSWGVAAAVFLALLVSAGVRSMPGALLVPLEQDLHWSRATISVAISVGIALYGLIGPF